MTGEKPFSTRTPLQTPRLLLTQLLLTQLMLTGRLLTMNLAVHKTNLTLQFYPDVTVMKHSLRYDTI